MKRLDLEYLQSIYNQLDEIQRVSTRYGTYQSNPELLDIVDHLARVAGFLANLQIQEHEHGQILTSNPKSYIDSKLSIAHDGMIKYGKKTAKDTLV